MAMTSSVAALSTVTDYSVGHKSGHKTLKRLRSTMSSPGQIVAESCDLSDGADFNWRAYIASRPDKNKIVGPGITRVECRFLSARDPNYRTLQVPNRFDFVSHRIDGTIARVHPETSQHGHCDVHHRIVECVIHGSTLGGDILPLYSIPAESAFNPIAEPRGSVPRHDTIGASAAFEWLEKHVEMGDWPQNTTPPLTALAASPGYYSNWIDLYDATSFRWHQFWAARSHWGSGNQVCTFGAARWMPAQSRRDFGGEQFDAKPVFVCGMRDGRTGVVFFHVKRTGPADKDAVTAAIDWINPGEAAVAGPTAWLDPGAEAAGPTTGPLPHRGAPALRWREEAAQAAAQRPRARRPVRRRRRRRRTASRFRCRRCRIGPHQHTSSP